MFSKCVLFKKRHLNKRAGVWTPWTPPGSATMLTANKKMVEGSYQAKSQLDSFIRFNSTSTCDRHRGTQTQGRGIYSANITLRGKKALLKTDKI